MWWVNPWYNLHVNGTNFTHVFNYTILHLWYIIIIYIYIILYYIILYYIYYIILYYIIYMILYYIMLYYIILYYVILYYIICYVILYYIIYSYVIMLSYISIQLVHTCISRYSSTSKLEHPRSALDLTIVAFCKWSRHPSPRIPSEAWEVPIGMEVKWENHL